MQEGHRSWSLDRCCDQKSAMFLEHEGVRTSNVVCGWNTNTCIDVRGDLQAESSGGCSVHHMQEAGAHVVATLQTAQFI